MNRCKLETAFNRTTYRVFLPETTLDLNIARHHPELDAWLKRHGARHWVVLSPCNPGARLLPDDVNAQHMIRLKTLLHSVGLRHFPALGLPPPKEAWPPEPSLLLLDPTPEQTLLLARLFGQLAWVEGRLAQPASLVWSSTKE